MDWVDLVVESGIVVTYTVAVLTLSCVMQVVLDGMKCNIASIIL